ncbi:MAG: hypothetical protein LBR25_07905 [Erysipelotrichaceae bacterium]|jgi:hypothetical protein|nr:hypothetical protein [Erysipelotrichaceae bacterium]
MEQVKDLFKKYSKIIDFVLFGYMAYCAVLIILQMITNDTSILEMETLYTIGWFLQWPVLLLGAGVLFFAGNAWSSRLHYVVTEVALLWGVVNFHRVSSYGFTFHYFPGGFFAQLVLLILYGGAAALLAFMLFTGKTFSVNDAVKAAQSAGNKVVEEGKKLGDKVDGDKK